MTITRNEATALVQSTVNQLASAAGDVFLIQPEFTVEVANGWVFFYNSEEFVRTGEPSAALAGNGPIFVTLEGKVHALATHTSWEKQLASL
ncbi:YrhB domain-containing protein [Hydrogenophaga sp.]|uniref:YrhB domain-containing protein n=1 Tax=Hydrogenophaga sp. TaxID=1904254 RepID=UPI002FCAD4A8